MAGASAAVEQIVTRLAVHHLPGAPTPELRESIPPDVARQVVDRAMAARVSGSLVAAVTAGLVDLGAEATDDLVARHGDELTHSLRVEEVLWELTHELGSDGIDHRVIKGPAIAHLDEPDPSWRTFGDLDLLVGGADIDRVVERLERRGATRQWAERRPGFESRFAKSVTLSTTAGIEVDLHRSLCDGAHGFRIPLERVLRAAEPFDLAGTDVFALTPVHRLLHAAYHAVLGSPRPRLMSLRDIAGYLARADIACAEVVAEARRWRGEAVLAEAVLATGHRFGWIPDSWSDWVEGWSPPPREERIIARQKVEGSSFGPAKLDAVRELAWRDRPAYVLALAVPSGAHLRSRGMGRLDLVRGVPERWARRVRRAGRIDHRP